MPGVTGRLCIGKCFFDVQKNDLGERLTLFRHCFIPDIFGEYQYVENVSFYLNNREICEPIKLPCLREVYCAIYIEENIANFKTCLISRGYPEQMVEETL